MTSSAESLAKITPYLLSQKALTLCCADEQGPYCCNCFYVFDSEAVAFYITSQLTTHHAQVMLKSPQVAGTIHAQPISIVKIKGVQFQGVIHLLSGQTSARAYTLFCNKYPVARVKAAPMWSITLNKLKMTDNTLGFGKKIMWSKND